VEGGFLVGASAFGHAVSPSLGGLERSGSALEQGIGRTPGLLSRRGDPWTDGEPELRWGAVSCNTPSSGLRQPSRSADEGLVTSFARLLSRLTTAPGLRRLILASGVVTSVCVALLTAAPAGAVIAEAGGVKVGLQPRLAGAGTEGAPEVETESFANANGNVVLHGAVEYAIYWDPNKQFHHEWVTNVDEFLQALGTAGPGTPFADLGQYRDRSNAITPFEALFKGSYSDTGKLPAKKCTDPKNPATTCITDAQLREQLESFIASHGLPTGMGTVYYLLTPPGTTVCLEVASVRCSNYSLSGSEETKHERKSASYKESFCSYHSDINLDGAPEGDSSTVLYAAIPWVAYTNAYDCQDGGFNPEKHESHLEKERELTSAEEAALAADTKEIREVAEEERRLEGPHIEEPNQEGKDEEGDYSAGLTDLLINQIAQQEMDTVTDPLLTSWHATGGGEVTDLCRNSFASTAGVSGGAIGGSVKAELHTEAGTLSNVTLGERPYYINNIFNLARFTNGEDADPCAGGVGLVARFTAPNQLKAGEIMGVDGMESTVSLIRGDAFGPSGPPSTTYATFTWNFGDGTPEVKGFAPGAPQCESPWLSPCAASEFHTYQYGGTYEVTLTISDVAGNTASVTHDVSVAGAPRPSSSGGSGGSAAAAAGAGANSSGGASSAGHGAVPPPIASAAIARQSLHTALHKGLTVDYSVNEQVAGHFEVLLARATAHRLGITGSPAVGLPAGSPTEVVIAKAILVTTKGGHSALHITFSKRTAARLARAHKVALMLRLTVRNAASVDPLTTSVVTSITLTG
jgi:hypothetical protein